MGVKNIQTGGTGCQSGPVHSTTTHAAPARALLALQIVYVLVWGRCRGRTWRHAAPMVAAALSRVTHRSTKIKSCITFLAATNHFRAPPRLTTTRGPHSHPAATIALLTAVVILNRLGEHASASSKLDVVPSLSQNCTGLWWRLAMMPANNDAVPQHIVQPLAPCPQLTYTFTGGAGDSVPRLGRAPTRGRESGAMGRQPAHTPPSLVHAKSGSTCRTRDSKVCRTAATLSGDGAAHSRWIKHAYTWVAG